MPRYKGSKTYLIIPEGRWANQVPALISQENYPDQSIGWFVDSVWYRPTWTEARNQGELGPVRELTDTGRVPNVDWWLTSFAVNKHPPFLRYGDSSKGLHELSFFFVLRLRESVPQKRKRAQLWRCAPRLLSA